MKARMDEQSAAFEGIDVEELATIHEATGLKLMPHWVAQPYFRPLPGVRPEIKAKTEKVAVSSSSVVQQIEVAAA